MKRHLVTFSIEVYGDSPEEVQENAEWIRENVAEMISDLGEYGHGDSTKVASIDGTPCPATQEDLEDAAAEQARVARVARKREPGEHLRIERVAQAAIHARVDRDDGRYLHVTVREHGNGERIDRTEINDISTWHHICGHGVDHMKGDCTDCGARVRDFLHGLLRGGGAL